MENEEPINRRFYQNPYFDDVFGLLQNDFPIPTKQSRDKAKIKEFRKRVVNLLTKEERESWPRKGKLLIMVSISCPRSYIGKVDVDNFVKLLFDIFKGYVYKDDSQVYYLMADKNIHPLNMIGFFAGVRELKVDEQPDDNWPSLFSSNENDWRQERLEKFGKSQ